MELNQGHIFQALVTCHNTLRDNRDKGSVQDMIMDGLRPDPGRHPAFR